MRLSLKEVRDAQKVVYVAMCQDAVICLHKNRLDMHSGCFAIAMNLFMSVFQLQNQSRRCINSNLFHFSLSPRE